MKNVILFMLDQFSAKWLEQAIEKNICPLENFTKLINDGVYFKNAITSNPVCCAARATLATGLTTSSHGVLENGYTLDPSIPTFMKTLQEKGYSTAMFGKLHFRPHFESMRPDYKQYGFDVTKITEDCRGGEWLDWILENHEEFADDVLATIWPTEIPEYASYGKDNLNLRKRIKEIRETYNWGTEKYPQNTPSSYTQKFPKELSQTEWITDNAIKYLSEKSPEKPFFAQISYVQPHGPHNTPEEYMQFVDESKIPQPLNAEWFQSEDSPLYFQNAKKVDETNIIHDRKCYFADLIHLDEQLGKVTQCLKDTNQFDESVILHKYL